MTKEPYHILVLDPAESTGYAVVLVDEDKSSADIFRYGFLDVDTSSNYMGDWLLDLNRTVMNLINEYGVKMVVCEDFFFSSRFTSGSNVNPAYRAAIHMAARFLKVPYEILNISQWKSFVVGRSVPTKEQKKKWGKTAANKKMVAEALVKRWKIELPTYSFSPKTGKPIKFRYDISDAIGQAVCYVGLMMGIRTITCSVPVPPPNPKFPPEF